MEVPDFRSDALRFQPASSSPSPFVPCLLAPCPLTPLAPRLAWPLAPHPPGPSPLLTPHCPLPTPHSPLPTFRSPLPNPQSPLPNLPARPLTVFAPMDITHRAARARRSRRRSVARPTLEGRLLAAVTSSTTAMGPPVPLGVWSRTSTSPTTTTPTPPTSPMHSPVAATSPDRWKRRMRWTRWMSWKKCL